MISIKVNVTFIKERWCMRIKLSKVSSGEEIFSVAGNWYSPMQ